MKVLFYLGHPAHFHLFRYTISNLQERGHEIIVTVKKKDILEELLNNEGINYINILPKGRKDNKFSIALGLIVREINLFNIVKLYNPEIMLGTSAEIAHIGRIRGVPSIVVNEDDYNIVPLFSYLAYPFSNYILAPNSCNVGPWRGKNISYEGYHELAYLHPNQFIPDFNIVRSLLNNNDKYFILRFAKLSAHHDTGRKGITPEIASKIISLLEPHGNVYITAERKLEPQYEKYRINLNPLDIHHALYYASMYVGDSQTMAAEAAVLGTPSIRFNDFVGEIGYLEELEHLYGLTFGIKTNQPELLYQKIQEFLATDNLKKEWQSRREKMLADKIDVTKFIVDLIENYSPYIKKYGNN